MNVPRVESSTAARSQQRSQTFPRQGSLQGPSSRRLSVKLNAPNALNTAPSLNSRKGKARDRPLPGVQFGRRTANAERKWHSKSCTELTTSALSETVVPEAEEQNIPLEKRLTNEKLRHLEQVFHEADEDGGGRLGMDKFRIIMRQAMGDHLTNQELDIIFLSYMLLQHLQKDYISQAMQEKPLPKVPRFVPNMNRYQSFNDYIVQIQNMPIPCPRPRHARHGSRGHWREIRVGHQRRRGPFWTMAMKHVKRFKLEAPPRSVGPWVVDTVYMSKVHMVVITTTAATITFYDLTTKFEPIKVVTALEVAATCIAYWVDPKDYKHSVLLWGDTRGNVTALEFSGSSGIYFLRASLNQSDTRVSFSQLQKGQFCGVKVYKVPKVHDDFVMQVKYIAPLGCFFSCSQTRRTSMFVGDLQQKKSSYFCVNMGILDFDYSEVKNIVVTGGKDSLVRVWNPYIPTKPVMLFHGHNSRAPSLM